MNKLLLPLLIATGALAPWAAQAHTEVEVAIDVPGIAVRIAPPLTGWVAPPVVYGPPVVQYAPPPVAAPVLVVPPYPIGDARLAAYGAGWPQWRERAWEAHEWQEHQWREREWREHHEHAWHDHDRNDRDGRGWERR